MYLYVKEKSVESKSNKVEFAVGKGGCVVATAEMQKPRFFDPKTVLTVTGITEAIKTSKFVNVTFDKELKKGRDKGVATL
jgi:hypothetical protein